LDLYNDEDAKLTSAVPFKMENILMDFKIELLPDDPNLEQKNRLLIFSRVAGVLTTDQLR